MADNANTPKSGRHVATKVRDPPRSGWAPHMDPWTLAYLAGHRDMNITKRYVHPQEQTIRAAMDRARAVEGGHTFGHTAQI